MIDLRSLIKAGVHFGHQKSRWCPKMAPYIWGHKNNVHLIDVSKTAAQLEKASKFLEDVASQGLPILWVGTKKAAQASIEKFATQLDMPYVNHRWIGGTLSNYAQVKKSVTKLLYYEDVLEKSEKFPHYTKKEFNTIQKAVDRLKKNVGGIRKLTWPVAAIGLVDVNKEKAARLEATRMGVQIVGIADTNSDPEGISYVVPANDDAPRSIEVVLEYLAQAVAKGATKAPTKRVARADAEAAEITPEQQIAFAMGEDESEDAAKKKGAPVARRPVAGRARVQRPVKKD